MSERILVRRLAASGLGEDSTTPWRWVVFYPARPQGRMMESYYQFEEALASALRYTDVVQGRERRARP
ncbi:MAG: hypothetical protein ACRCSN_19770 [Dermatophilaceae bacterium]